jgi:ubiquinone/menaquinone biosynthesis C-methylase UbiE
MVESTPRENYQQRGNVAHVDQIAQRTALRDAEFLLPYLKPGMRILDVGCGPGSITIGLAGVVAPGEVVGVDIQPEMVERATAAAAEAGVENVRFEAGDCYKLPFPDASFDVCYANSVLQHRREPVAALKEMRRVLRPGGVAGVRDLTDMIYAPRVPLLDEAIDLVYRTRRHNGGNPEAGLYHRRDLLAAGFARTQAAASVDAYGTLEETRRSLATVVPACKEPPAPRLRRAG